MGQRLKRGYFITFEGVEGSGKSTHIQFAVKWLKRTGRSVVCFREPGGTRTSEAVRRILLDPGLSGMKVETELLLYLAARAELVREKIEPTLRQGNVVILDRYEDSTLAYQGFGGRIPLRVIRDFSRFVRGRAVPDLTFLLDVETKQGLRRSGRRDRMEKKSVSFHQRVRKGFLALACRNPKRFVLLTTRDPVKEVRARIEKELRARL